ncbi:MAG: alpha/beta hydrolase [Candidatus Kuenenia sp.]|nr:alpha/beta hydrolase [Candidatus Kuenenia hertensis]
MITQNTWHTIGLVLSIPIVLYSCLIAIMMVFQPRFVYFPRSEIVSTPGDIGLSYEEVTFQTKDGLTIYGWFIPAKQARGVLLFCHGNAGNISHRLDSIKVFHDLGLSTLIFDYRGYGKSKGRLSEKGTYCDAEAAWDYLIQNRHVLPEKIVIFGRSLGGAIATWLATEHTPGALIVESAFTSITDVGAELYPYIPIRCISRFRYGTINYLKAIDCPVLIVHSRGDELISFKHGRWLFDAAPEPKEFLEITGDHNEGFLTSGKRYRDGIDSFLIKYLK